MTALLEKQRDLLDALDTLKQIGIEDSVQLPKVVLISNYSDSKSRVLEAIEPIWFPREQCIELGYPTEIAFHRDTEASASVTFKGAKVDSSAITGDSDKTCSSISEIVNGARKYAQSSQDNADVAPDQVLRIDISRDAFPELTIVDLPSFSSADDTTEPGSSKPELFTETTEHYLAQPNNVILAVVSGSEMQTGNRVLDMVRKYDPYGTRTLGVITSASTPVWAEGKCIQMAKDSNTTGSRTLGWHVLFDHPKSGGPSTPDQSNGELEHYLQSHDWLKIPPRARGLAFFKEKLHLKLLNQTEQGLAGLISHLQGHVMLHQERLAGLGEERSTATEMRNYLNDIATRFQMIATQGVLGDYIDPIFGGVVPEHNEYNTYTQQRTRHLRGLIRDLNKVFYTVLVEKGGKFKILQPGHELVGFGAPQGQAQGLDGILTQDLQQLVNLYSELDTPTPIQASQLEAIALGTDSMGHGNSLSFSDGSRQSSALFQAQTAHWGSIAEKHTDLCLLSAKSFVSQVLAHVAPDLATVERLFMRYVTPFFDERRAILREKVGELLEHYQSGCDPYPLDMHFRSIQHRMTGDQSGSRTPWTVSGKQVVQEMAKRLETSLMVFTDNVVILAVENCLLRHIPTIFCPDVVSSMTEETVKECAFEPECLQEERKILKSRLETLTKVLTTLQAYGPKEQIELGPAPVLPLGVPPRPVDQPTGSSLRTILPILSGAPASRAEQVQGRANAATVPSFESAGVPGTRLLHSFSPYSQEVKGYLGVTQEIFQNIGFMDKYKEFSTEEIRLQDYLTSGKAFAC
ncbi:hypothetical protein V8F20_012658 [Naviculisporaceae sp. PSN 640]